MSEEKIDALVNEYPEAYQNLIRDCMMMTEQEFKTFVISLIM